MLCWAETVLTQDAGVLGMLTALGGHGVDLGELLHRKVNVCLQCVPTDWRASYLDEGIERDDTAGGAVVVAKQDEAGCNDQDDHSSPQARAAKAEELLGRSHARGG